jgi:hypothetical protein
LTILDNYSLTHYLTSYLESGAFPGKLTWKKTVNSAVSLYEDSEWTNLHDFCSYITEKGHQKYGKSRGTYKKSKSLKL